MKKKILFIDDELGEENSQAHQISKTLSNRGFEILPCISFEWDEIYRMIQVNYRSLRLILCDLKDSSNNLTGWKIISTIKSKENKEHLIEGNDWFIECIPIIVITQVPEYYKEEQEHGGELVTLFDKAACQGPAFLGCVDILTNLFDKLCQGNMNNRIAISYTWNNKKANDNHKLFVEYVAHKLFQQYKEKCVFYDSNKISTTAGTKLDKLTESVYCNGCDFVLIFLSNDYANSGWTKAEWEQTKQRKDEQYLFVAIDDLGKEKFAIAKTLFPEEWDKEVLNDNDEKEKDLFFNRHMPLYIDFYANKCKFDASITLNNLQAHNEFLKGFDKEIKVIIDNIENRI